MESAGAAKYSFRDDYSDGAHPGILAALKKTNQSQQSGYGDDEYCDEARKIIRKLIGSDDASIYFTPGGTGANLLAIASHLRPHEAIIAAESGHIVGKECGCVEAIGHKILVEPADAGKLTPERIQSAVDKSSLFAYQTQAKMVYIANATELGTVYTRTELEAVAAICKKLNLLLLMDGARLGAAMASHKNDMTFADFFRLTDVFWIGGTKNGALLGEAIVIKDPIFGADFPYHMKQRGMLLAKGRILGIQFSTLLRNNLLLRLAKHANDAAAQISASLVQMGYKLWNETDSNQVFVIFPPTLVRKLEELFDFLVWENLDDGSQVVRLVTSWATMNSEVNRLCAFVVEWTARSRLVNFN
ncbi:putative threonine aldolase [Cercophora newfieldiana]|uniref:Threonine aldolase n=1 Tax=Cercophora newfieldiana TaxID=92897 RepID=A0AA40CIM9_9PEZI|nr:putative threonine aldolase [Cercophora newfieldiana]